MAGLYLHIPFCASRCIYCGFYSTTRLDMRQQYVDAMCREMEKRPTGGVETVYLGGGTPSQLTVAQLRQLFIYINKVYDVAPDAEVTMEMNPDDVTEEYAAVLQRLGVNRVSLGAQTFDDRRLQFLHRRHSAAQVAEAVARLRHAGMRNISVDLMYGFPGETVGDWQRDIDAVLALDVEHVSAYCLMIEEGTPLARMLDSQNGPQDFAKNGPDDSQNGPQDFAQKGSDDSEELERTMYYTLIDRLTAAGYEHYEISNFARRTGGPALPSPRRSRHNSSYWQDIPYIGLGAAAHSYDGQRRSWNVSNIKQYIESINSGIIPCEYEELDADTHYNDRIATALRTNIGLDLTTLSDHHQQYCLKEAQCYIKDGSLRLDNNHLILTRKGLFISDYIMSSLMMI